MKASKTLGLVAVTMLMAPGSAQAWEWQFETARHTMTAKGVYMDLSSDGIPHLAIEEQSNIRYAVRGDTGWVVEVAGSTGGSVKGAALRLDSAGRPHVVYSYHTLSGPLPDYIRHSVRTDTGWVWLSNVTRNDGGFGPKALLATASGGLALAFHNKYHDTIHYATWSESAGWSGSGTIGSGEAVVSMAWDAQGRPVVAYRERSGSSSSDLMFAEPQPPGTYGWAKTEVDDGYYVPASAAIGAADNGDIFIAYSVQAEKELIVATRHNDIWTTETVDVGTSTPGALSMAIDSHGRPNVAYRLDGEVRFARFDGNAWDIHVVDTGGSYTGDQALALGSDDLPWISFVRYEDTFVRPVIVAHAVPEPASIGVLVLAGLAMIRRNR